MFDCCTFPSASMPSSPFFQTIFSVIFSGQQHFIFVHVLGQSAAAARQFLDGHSVHLDCQVHGASRRPSLPCSFSPKVKLTPNNITKTVWSDASSTTTSTVQIGGRSGTPTHLPLFPTSPLTLRTTTATTGGNCIPTRCTQSGGSTRSAQTTSAATVSSRSCPAAYLLYSLVNEEHVALRPQRVGHGLVSSWACRHTRTPRQYGC